MKMSDLIRDFRIGANDRADPYLFEDSDVARYFTEAQEEACIRAQLLTDTSPTAMCVITLAPTQTRYQLDPRVLEVERVSIDDIQCSLARASFEELDGRPHANTLAGSPRAYALTGMPAAGLTLVIDRQPGTRYTTMRLTVKRLPLAALRVPTTSPLVDDVPEIPLTLHAKLTHWPLYRAFLTRDPDAGSDSMATRHLALFEQAFGVRPDANVARKRLRHRPPITTPDIGPNARPRTHYNPTVDPD